MEHRTLTFVYGATHYQATLWIRARIASGDLQNANSRNITNPETLRGIRSTENTTIQFVWLRGCEANKTHKQFVDMMQQRQVSGANIKEFQSQ